MRPIVMVVALFCAQVLAAQSLGDVAREQRDDTSHPKAKRVFTNADLSSPESVAPAKATTPAALKPAGASATQPKSSAKPASTAVADPERAMQQRHIAELNQRVKTLEGELGDLERERNTMKANSHFGDPNRSQSNGELSAVGDKVDQKQQELAAARGELSEAIERFNRGSVLK
jgi:hypothetical protein